MLELRNLSISAPIALDCADMKLEAGQKIALIGPSGAGKSTFFKALGGFVPFNQGQVLWNGAPFQNLDPANRPVSSLFQSNNLFVHLSVRDNIALGVDPALKLSQDAWRRVDGLMEMLGIAPIASKRPRQISGGEAARAALARVILQDRGVVLFDEPFSALGPAQIKEIQSIVDAELLPQNRLLLFISHQMDEVRHWADRVIWLDGGMILSPIITKKFFLKPPQAAQCYFGV